MESRRQAAFREDLAAAGIEVLDLPLKTGLVAKVGTGEAPFIALRCDIDGLPIQEESGLAYASEHAGRMHACGHDFHISAVLGSAYLLKAKERELRGTVYLIFQPAEEAPGGARKVMETGVLKDRIGHLWPAHLRRSTMSARSASARAR